MNADNHWRNFKPYIAVIAGFALGGISMIFFVAGFSFGTELMFSGKNVAFPVAIVISLVNTVIQFTWNEEREDIWEWVLWCTSYVVGIFSNYLGLVAILNMSDPMIEKVIAGALGAMIEIAPEKLILRGLREIKVDLKMPNLGSKKKPAYQNQNQQPNQNRPKQSQPGPFAHQNMNAPAQARPVQGIKPQASSRPLYSEPTYHPVGMNSKPRTEEE